MSAMAYDDHLHQMVLVESDIRFGAPTQLWTWDGAALAPAQRLRRAGKPGGRRRF
jgi:hypothetical protein